MHCGYRLQWYDLIPLVSWLMLGGRCRNCKEKISVQYPVIEALNGVLYLIVFARFGVSIECLLVCLLTSALVVLSVIDFRTYEIPFGINVFIAVLGLFRILTDRGNWTEYVIGFFSVSLVLYVLYLITKGQGIGGGDIKLMAASGLLLGWQCNILAFVLGCIIGSVCHLIRMRLGRADNILALGPYLSVGIYLCAMWGNEMIRWYFSML